MDIICVGTSYIHMAFLFHRVHRAHDAWNDAGAKSTSDQAAILLRSQSLGVSRSICVDVILYNCIVLKVSET